MKNPLDAENIVYQLDLVDVPEITQSIEITGPESLVIACALHHLREHVQTEEVYNKIQPLVRSIAIKMGNFNG